MNSNYSSSYWYAKREVLSSVVCPLVCLPDSSGDFNLQGTQKDLIKSRGQQTIDMNVEKRGRGKLGVNKERREMRDDTDMSNCNALDTCLKLSMNKFN